MASDPTALDPGTAAELLAGMGAAIAAEARALPLELASWHPAPGEWCAKEVLGHLIEAERRGFNGRIRTILAGTDPFLPTWDQEAVAEARRDCQQPVAKLLDEFLALRQDSVALVRGLKASDLPRGGQHETVGYLRVGDLLHEWTHHDRNHVRQMLANVQSYVWPHMGNAQKFSGD
jgi:ribosomal protein L30/L7E